MAGSEKLGEVYVEIRAKIDKLEAELKKAQGTAQTSAKKVENEFNKISPKATGINKYMGDATAQTGKLGHALDGLQSKFTGVSVASLSMAVGVGLLAGALKRAITSAFEYQDSIVDLSEQMGFQISTTQALDYMMKKEGKSVESVSAGFTILMRQMQEAKTKGGEAKAMFEKLGVALYDDNLQARSTEAVFMDVNEAIHNTVNPSERAGKALEVYGRAWKNMAPLFLEGKAGVAAASAELKALNVNIDVERTKRYEEAVARMKMTFTGLTTQVFRATFAIGDYLGKTAFFNWLLIKNLGNYGKAVKEYNAANAEVDAAEKKRFDDRMAMINAAGAQKEGLTEDEVKTEQKVAEEKATAIKAYYDTIKFLSADYMNYRIAQINIEAMALKAKAGKEIDIETWKYNELKKLDKEYKDLIGGVGARRGGKPERGLPSGIPVPYMPGGSNLGPGGENIDIIKAEDAQKRFEDTYNFAEDKTSAFFNGMLQISIQTDNRVAQGFVNMANAFTAEVERMMAKWAAFQALRAISSIPGLGFLSALIPGGASGGEFVGTSSGVRKVASFAGGGSFTVPAGFNNDSFPMMVQTGERVSVTPSGGTGKDIQMLSEINKSIKIMNLNNMAMQKQINVNAQVSGNLQGRDLQLAVEKSQRFDDRTR